MQVVGAGLRQALPGHNGDKIGFPFPGLATWDRPTALRTARALRALEPARLAPGHGRVVEDPLAAMDAAIARGAR